ncbi:MAG TPA: hypothetical protein VMM37_10300, partial [Bacteroidota bacterium]|nr:hypothetical protein [Bacteroidota bacterium]
MKKFVMAMMFLVVAYFGNVAAMASGETHTMQGYLIDKMCGVKMAKLDAARSTEKAMKHTKDCALEDMC